MSALSEQILALSTAYLGPAAKVFLQRQTNAHMSGLSFDALEKQHLPDLSHWVFTSAILIIEEPKAKELSEKIKSLG
jgi:hypothetical protein